MAFDTVVATLQQTIEAVGDSCGDLVDVLAGQRETVADQRDVLGEHHEALWAGLRAGKEAPGVGAPQETDHG